MLFFKNSYFKLKKSIIYTIKYYILYYEDYFQ